MSSVCRVCLAAGNTRLRSLKNDTLIEVYEKLSNTQFNSKDAGSRVLCTFCYRRLMRCHTFSQMIQRTENIFSHLFHEGLEKTQEHISQVNHGIKQHLSVATMQFISIDYNTTDADTQITIKDEPMPSIDIKEELITEQDSAEVDYVPENFTKSLLSSVEDDSHQGNDVEELPSNSHIEQTNRDVSKMPVIKAFACNVCDKQLKQKTTLVTF